MIEQNGKPLNFNHNRDVTIEIKYINADLVDGDGIYFNIPIVIFENKNFHLKLGKETHLNATCTEQEHANNETAKNVQGG